MRYTYRVANTDRQIKLATLLCEHLAARDKHKTETRMTLCRALAFVGESDSANVLYKAMNERNPRLQEMARWALVRDPSDNSTNALIGGLQIAADDLLVGVINGMGERGDVRAVNALAHQIYNRNAPPAAAALDALAQLPHPMSVKAIETAIKDKKPGALDALLDLANNLIDNDMPSEARAALIPLVDVRRTPVDDFLLPEGAASP